MMIQGHQLCELRGAAWPRGAGLDIQDQSQGQDQGQSQGLGKGLGLAWAACGAVG